MEREGKSGEGCNRYSLEREAKAAPTFTLYLLCARLGNWLEWRCMHSKWRANFAGF